jgi:hypothetical protein
MDTAKFTPRWRYEWAEHTEKRPSSPKVTRLGFWRDPHYFRVLEPPQVGMYGTFVNVKAQHGTSTTYAMPLAIFTVLFAAVPTVSVAIAWRRAWRIRKGRCPKCSYNLTGNSSGRCPECGCAIPAVNRFRYLPLKIAFGIIVKSDLRITFDSPHTPQTFQPHLLPSSD